jgi:hypothetical protein
VPLEPAVNLSPFGGKGTPRPDDFWLGKLTNSKKKGKKTKWVDATRIHTGLGVERQVWSIVSHMTVSLRAAGQKHEVRLSMNTAFWSVWDSTL